MPEELAWSVAPRAMRLASANGIATPDHEHEGRLDQVPERDPLPVAVVELAGDAGEGRIVPGQPGQAESGGDQHHHDEPAKSVQRQVALRLRGRSFRLRRGCHGRVTNSSLHWPE